MSFQQCLACNAVVPKASKTCECGHVFEDVKQIAGKRFSEYRAELYWRLESKRMKALSKENQPLQNSSSDQNNNIENENADLSGEDDNSEVAVKSQRKQGQAPKKRMFRRRMSGLYPTAKKLSKPVHVTYPCLENKNEMIVSPEERSRFSKALESINKKILSQNLVWTNFLSWDFPRPCSKSRPITHEDELDLPRFRANLHCPHSSEFVKALKSELQFQCGGQDIVI